MFCEVPQLIIGLSKSHQYTYQSEIGILDLILYLGFGGNLLIFNNHGGIHLYIGSINGKTKYSWRQKPVA
jgi:hypothetical protein